MRYTKIIFLFSTIVIMNINLHAQKQSFDVVSYSLPKGWQKQQNEAGVQLSVSDKKTGGYAIAIITKATASDGTANENFTKDWNRLVKSTVQVNAEPTMQDPSTDNGWDIVSGNANYADGSNKGLATLLTATGGGQTVSVVLLTNTQKYQDELLAFLNSLELAKIGQKEKVNTSQAPKSSVVGLWCDYTLETTGYSINGMQQYTAGYLRKEYAFYPDGTYLFRNKQWLTKTKDILFIYESGTYTIQGNQLILTPKGGESEFWEKTSSTKEWGKPLKTSDYKLEKTIYVFEINTDPTYGKKITLKPGKPTVRDGGKFNAPNDPYEFRYSFRELESLIDNPPGLKTGFENKTFTEATKEAPPIDIHSPLTGKTWEAKSYEKYGAAYGNTSGSYTGGFWYYQYKFNANGSYTFVYNAASALATEPVNVLQYETGTYTVNGNLLTLTPQMGANEEWSTGKTNNGMSAEHIREVLEKRIQRLKKTTRVLEKTTYSFTVEYWQGNNANALCLKHTQHTVREGSPGQNNQSCFFETAGAKAENYSTLFK